MKGASSPAFAHQVLLASLVAIGFTGTAGLGTVWMRHQISVVANDNKVLEARIAAVERGGNELAAEIAAAEDPAVLQRRNLEWRLNLVPPDNGVIKRIDGDSVVDLLSKNNRSLSGDHAREVTFRATVQP